VFGRILRLNFAREARRNKFRNENENMKKKIESEKTSFKKIKKAELLKKVYDQTNWNSLFINPNTVLAKMAEKFGLQKKDILGKEVENGAVRLALCETEILQETRSYLESQGVNLTAFEKEMGDCVRSHNTLMVKNIPQEATK
jgi:multiple RNA-binding domain-containing protein 1